MSFQPILKRNWWQKNKAFKLYMLREITVIPLAFFLINLLLGLLALYQGELAWLNWLQYMAKPWVVVGHVLALLAAIFHAATFFILFPRVMPLSFRGKSIASYLIVFLQWFAVIAVLLTTFVLLS